MSDGLYLADTPEPTQNVSYKAKVPQWLADMFDIHEPRSDKFTAPVVFGADLLLTILHAPEGTTLHFHRSEPLFFSETTTSAGNSRKDYP